MYKRKHLMDFAKEKSSWHFDESIHEQSYQSVCQFWGDWHSELKSCIQRADEAEDFLTISLGSYSGLGVHIQEEEMERWGYTKGQKFVDNLTDPQFEAARKMTTACWLLKPKVELLRLRPGYMLPWHCDMPNSCRKLTNPSKPIARYLVALDDWKWGHYMTVGNSIWHQWKKGMCITWPYRMYHATANCGIRSLLFLTITGQVCDRSIHLGSPQNISI